MRFYGFIAFVVKELQGTCHNIDKYKQLNLIIFLFRKAGWALSAYMFFIHFPAVMSPAAGPVVGTEPETLSAVGGVL